MEADCKIYWALFDQSAAEILVESMTIEGKPIIFSFDRKFSDICKGSDLLSDLCDVSLRQQNVL